MSFSYNKLKSKKELHKVKTTYVMKLKKFYSPKKNISEVLFRKQLRKSDFFKGNLVAHSNFVFLEYVDIAEQDFKKMNEVTEQFNVESIYMHAYKLDDAELLEKYSKLDGKEIQLNNYNRKQYKTKIVDFVIINDEHSEPPYLAAVVESQEEHDIYYAWSSETSIDPYPFEKQEFEEGGDEKFAIMYWDSKFYNDLSLKYGENYEYQRDDVFQFKSKDGEEFVLVQNCVIGHCEGMIESEFIVFKKVKEKYDIISSGALDHFVIDFIDVEGDGFPEVLVADFASSAIIDISKPKSAIKYSFEWSSQGCPC
ncbi:MAG: hypothetical protein BM555_05105 [Crocinitomix sp. MedPE-SWsnd]|nr:MAG: hypothetical protein BM555_05105 [Crocinitomix sp. MedPE-SWsnd]